jgi:hypothetical protein
MESILIVYNDIKELTHGYQNYITSQMLIFGGYVKMRKSLYTRVTIWDNIMILNLNDTVSPRYEGPCF